MKWKFYFLLLSVSLYPPFSAAAIDLSVNEILHYEYSKDGTEVNIWTKGAAIQEDRTILSPSREQISANTYAIYPGEKFYQEAGTWYGIERYTEDAKTFVAPASSFFGIKKAFADFLGTTGIGETQALNANYNSARTANPSTSADNNFYSTLLHRINAGTYTVTRYGIFFDATGLTIASSTLRIRSDDTSWTNGDTVNLSLVTFDANTWGNITTSDHINFGSTKIANDIPFANLNNDNWHSFSVTDISTFTGQFGVGLVVDEDLSNVAPVGTNQITISDIYLLVETSGGSPTPTPGTSTATTTAADYERLSAFALTGAVSLLFFLVGFGLVVFIYKML